MTAFKLPRSGSAPLAFDGEQLVAVCGKDLWPLGKSRPPNRYHNITIFRTDTGRYVVSVTFRCDTNFDDPYDEAEVLDTPEEVVEYLEDFDPLDGVRGWTLEKHAEQDKRLRSALTANFETLVSRVLSSVDDFAERI